MHGRCTRAAPNARLKLMYYHGCRSPIGHHENSLSLDAMEKGATTVSKGYNKTREDDYGKV